MNHETDPVAQIRSSLASLAAREKELGEEFERVRTATTALRAALAALSGSVTANVQGEIALAKPTETAPTSSTTNTAPRKLKDEARVELQLIGGAARGTEIARRLQARGIKADQAFRQFHKTLDGILRREADLFRSLGDGRFALVEHTGHSHETNGRIPIALEPSA